MKRMYITLGIIALLLTWAISGLTQKSSSEREGDALKRHMLLREEIHKRIRNKLLLGVGHDDNLFKDMDALYQDMLSDSFKGTESFGNIVDSGYEMEWTESPEGRTLIITPKSKDQKLDISVQNSMISIQGETEQRTSQGRSSSRFHNSFNVPSDCDPDQLKMGQKGEKILLSFPYLLQNGTKARPQSKTERVPLPHSDSDIEI